MFDFLYDSEGEVSVPRILLTVAVILAVVASVWMLFDSMDASNVKNRLANDSILVEQTKSNIEVASGEITKSASLYADHWSTSQAGALGTAAKNFEQTGDVYRNLAAANEALAKGDRKSAKIYADKAEQLIGEAQAAVNAMLGPPKLFDQLADWAGQADSAVSTAQACIVSNQTALVAFQASVNFANGVTDLTNSQTLVNQAKAANEVPVERGIVDKPLVYQLAQQAIALCNKALTDAAPPTPTPEPPPPSSNSSSPIIIINNSGNSFGSGGGSGSSGDWGSPSGSDGGSSGWDSGGDSGSWGSGDGGWDSGGDSGSWGSGDGGWDSGGDSGSWDSGGDW